MPDEAPKPSLMSLLFGASPWTSIIGYVTSALVVVDEMVKAGGLPQDAGGWKQMGVGVAIAMFGRLTKQSNVTNASTPVAARAVPEAAALLPAPPPQES
jgi:hypothetical protein